MQTPWQVGCRGALQSKYKLQQAPPRTPSASALTALTDSPPPWAHTCAPPPKLENQHCNSSLFHQTSPGETTSATAKASPEYSSPRQTQSYRAAPTTCRSARYTQPALHPQTNSHS